MEISMILLVIGLVFSFLMYIHRKSGTLPTIIKLGMNTKKHGVDVKKSYIGHRLREES